MPAPVGAPLQRGRGLGRRRILLAGALALALVVYLRMRGGTSSAVGGDTIPTDNQASDALSGDTGSGGGGGGADTTALAAALEGLSSGLTDLQTAQSQTAAYAQSAYEGLAQLGQQVNDLENTPPSVYYVGSDATGAGDPVWGGPDAAPGNAKAATLASGFYWTLPGTSSPTFITQGNLSLFTAALARSGTSVGEWAGKHPDAAKAVGIPAPPPRATTPPHPTPTNPSPAPAPPTHPTPAVSGAALGLGAGAGFAPQPTRAPTVVAAPKPAPKPAPVTQSPITKRNSSPGGRGGV